MDSELDSSLEDNSAYYSSSSESEAKVQVIDTNKKRYPLCSDLPMHLS